jgi:hypothetical protein
MLWQARRGFISGNNAAMGGGFSPAALTGLIMWLDPTVTASLTLSGALVTDFADQSGAGNNAINHSGASRASYSATSLNGHPGVTYAGSFLNNSAFPMGTGNTLTVFAVYTLENIASGSARLINYAAPGFTDQNSVHSWVIARSGSTANPRMFRNGTESVPSNGSYTTPHRIIATIDGSGVITTYIDNVAAASATLNGNWTTAGLMSIGTDGTSNWNGVVGDIGIATGFTSSGNVALLDTYLKNKYGL